MRAKTLSLIALCFAACARCEELPAVCVVDMPAALPGETISVRALTVPALADARFVWKVSTGRILRAGSHVLWNLSDAEPGEQTVSAVIESDGSRRDCIARLLVLEPASVRGEVGSAALLPTQREGTGTLKYGAYTYILLASPAPDATTRERYVAALSAWQKLVPAIRAWENYRKPDQLNITFAPVAAAPPEGATPDWYVDHYDYARAKLILGKFPGENGRGPFLITSLKPLTGAEPAPRETLVQNLSTIPATMAAYWVESFLRQASQDRFWSEPARVSFTLRMRTVLESAGQVIGPVASTFSDLRGLIGWK